MYRAIARVVILLSLTTACAADEADPLQLTLPPVFYAVPGVAMSLYYDNVVLTETPEVYTFTVTCDVGLSEERRWTVIPTAEQVGDHPFAVTVADQDGKQLGRAETILRVVPAETGAGKRIKLLIVGDSLTHATVYPNEIARLLSLFGNPSWRMLGTHQGRNAAPGVVHEGYGGWTWSRFATHYEPEPDGTYKKKSSPFVFLEDDQPKLDLERYFQEECGGEKPDYVTFLLGINDCFSADPDDRAKIDARVDAMFAHAETLLAEFRKVCPQAELGVCVTTPPNSRQVAFEANYKDRFTRWGWKRIQHRLAQREIEAFGAREADRVFLVPTELNLDPIDGYPNNNGVHPNATGYRQIAASIYAWLKGRLAVAET